MKAKIKTLTLLAGLCWFGVTQAQPPIITTAVSASACAGNPVSVPILVDDLANVASISLALNINTSVITYTSYTANPILSGGMTLVNPTGNQVKGAYFGLTPIALASGSTLFTFNFNYMGGTSPLEWDVVTSGNCQYSDLNGMTLPATWVDGSVSPSSPAPVITGQPANASVYAGANVSFTVAANYATTFQWQESMDNGSTWTDVADGGMYSGSTTATLQIAGVTAGMDGYEYRCILMENSCNQSTTSNAGMLTILQPTTDLVTTAGTVIVCPPDTVIVPIDVLNFNDVASASLWLLYDTASLEYLGRQNQNPLIDTNLTFINASNGLWAFAWFSLMPVTLADGTLIELVFQYKKLNSSLSWDQVNSSYTDLNGLPLAAQWFDGTVSLPGPVINTHPADMTAIDGGNTSFTFTGSNITAYQWQESTDGGATWTNLANNAMYNGVTTDVLDIMGVTLSMDGYHYQCVVTGDCGNQVTNEANLSVISAQPVATTAPTQTVCAGSITIPVNVTDFTNVASFTLKLGYSTSALTFTGFQNLNPALNAASFSLNATGGVITATYTGTAGITIGNGVLFEITATALTGSSTLVWNSAGSNYMTPGGTSLPVTFTNGNITITPLPGFPGTIAGPASICAGTTGVNFTTTGSTNATSYTWAITPAAAGTLTPSGTSVAINFNATYSGTATVTVLGVNSCGNGPLNGKTVTVNPKPVVNLNTLPSLCAGVPPVALTGGTPTGGTYSGTGVTGGNFDPNVSGVGTFVITYIFTNTYGCAGTDTATITVNPVPVVTLNLGPWTAVCNYWDPFALTGGTPAGGTYAGAGVNSTTGFFYPANASIGYHILSYSYAALGCTGSATQQIQVSGCIGIEDPENEAAFAIMPNPSSGVFEVNIPAAKGEVTLTIFNDLGQSVYQENIMTDGKGTKKQLDLSSEPRGMYFLKLNGQDINRLEKVILK